jgi:hypothetical protein
MGIKIELTGDEALKYIIAANPDMIQLEETVKAAEAYIAALEKQVADLSETQVSSKVLRDTEIARDITPQFVIKEQANKQSDKRTGKWTEQELDVIEYAMGRPSNEQNRRFNVLVDKLGRTEGSVRSKLADMDIIVKDGVMHYR